MWFQTHPKELFCQHSFYRRVLYRIVEKSKFRRENDIMNGCYADKIQNGSLLSVAHDWQLICTGRWIRSRWPCVVETVCRICFWVSSPEVPDCFNHDELNKQKKRQHYGNLAGLSPCFLKFNNNKMILDKHFSLCLCCQYWYIVFIPSGLFTVYRYINKNPFPFHCF